MYYNYPDTLNRENIIKTISKKASTTVVLVSNDLAEIYCERGWT